MNNSVIRKIYREKDIVNMQSKINLLGTNRKFKFDAITFFNLRMLTTIFLTIVLFFININYYIIPFIIILYYNLLYYYLITREIKKRTVKLKRPAIQRQKTKKS